MDQRTITDTLYVAAFLLGGLGFAIGPIILALLLGPSTTRNVDGKTGQFIECGMVPIGSAWIRFGVVYYLYALMFLAFDVDVLFLFPVALAYNDPAVSGRDFFEVLLFVAILSLAVIYAWVKGVFKWETRTYRRP